VEYAKMFWLVGIGLYGGWVMENVSVLAVVLDFSAFFVAVVKSIESAHCRQSAQELLVSQDA
jgi:hypothetical protein